MKKLNRANAAASFADALHRQRNLLLKLIKEGPITQQGEHKKTRD